MRSPILLAPLALAVALAGCANLAPRPLVPGSELTATRALLGLSAADQTTADIVAGQLAPGQLGFFKADSGAAVMLTRDPSAPGSIAAMLPDRDGQLVEILATVEREGDGMRLVRPAVAELTPAEEEQARALYTQVTADLSAAPPRTPILVN